LGSFEQNIEQNRSEKKELLERKIGEKKAKYLHQEELLAC